LYWYQSIPEENNIRGVEWRGEERRGVEWRNKEERRGKS